MAVSSQRRTFTNLINFVYHTSETGGDMFRLTLIIYICFFFFINVSRAEFVLPPGSDCSNPDVTHIDMNCSLVFKERADKELNGVYKQLIAKLDKEGKDKLKASERAWIAYRDADVALVVYHYGEGGSLGRAIAAQRSFELTRERVKELRKRLEDDSQW